MLMETPRSNLDTFNNPTADLGATLPFKASAKTGMQESLSGMGWRAAKYWTLKQQASFHPIESRPDLYVGEEEFAKNYSLGGSLKFEPTKNGSMYRPYAESLVKDTIDDRLLQAQTQLGYHPTANLSGGLAGGFLSPVDLAVGFFVPEVKVATFGLGATVASRSGIGVARLASRTINGAVNGAVQGILTQAPIAALSEYSQRKYTLDDMLRNLAIAPVIGGVAGSLHAGLTHLRGETDRAFANAAMHAAMTDKDPTLLAKIAATDPRMKEALETRSRIRDLLSQDRGNEQQMELNFLSGENPSETMPDWPARVGEKDDTVHMADPEVTQVLRDRQMERNRYSRKVIDDVLANPEDKRIRGAETDDEKFLAEAWSKLFGVDLNFVDPKFAKQLGFAGFTRPSNPSRAYISAGALEDGTLNSMLHIAGHELAHAVRFKDPLLWNDMVGAMMKTSTMDNGALANAWRSVTRHSSGNSVWAGLDFHGKMDETFATVLGKATQSTHFWNSLNATAPASASKLAGFISGVRYKLQRMLDYRITKATKSLYEDLSSSLIAADADGRRLTDKHVTQPTALADLYANHTPGFKTFTRAMSEQLTARGRESDGELAKFISWQEQVFPEVAALSDQSAVPGSPGRFATILRNRKISSNNPGLWLLQSVFRKAKPGTEEFNTYSKWMQDVFSWDNDRLGNRKAADVTGKALQSHPALAAFKKNPDGTWDIGVYRNDDFPRWHEVFDNTPSETDLVSEAFIGEHLDAMRTEFRKFTSSVKEGETPRAVGTEFDEYIGGIKPEELNELVKEDPSALWQGYAEFLEAKMSDYRLERDPEAYKSLSDARHQIDPLLKADEGRGEGTDLSALKKAWDDLRKAYPEMQQKLQEHQDLRNKDPLGQGPLTQGVAVEDSREFFDQLFKEVRDEVAAELTETANGLRAFHLAKEGKGFEFSIARAMLGEEKFSQRLNAAIDEIAHDRIRNSGRYPQYDRVSGISKTVDQFHGEELGLHTANPRDLPSSHADGSELFGVADPLAEIDLNDYSYQAASPEDVANEVASRRLTLEEALKLPRVRLDREHAQWASWASNPRTAADAAIKDMLDRNKIEGWKLDQPAEKKKPAEGEVPKPPSPLEEKLDKIKGYLFAAQRDLEDYVNKGIVPARSLVDVERFDYHFRQNPDRVLALEAAATDIYRNAQAKVIQALNTHEATKSLIARAKDSLNSLASYLDGNARKGVKAAGSNVSEAMSARITADTTPFITDLELRGLDNLWISNDETLVRSLFREMKGLSKSDDPHIAALAATLKKIQEVQVGRMNSKGANIRLLDGYLFGQVHNPHAIKPAQAEFISDLRDWIDWEATERAIGPNAADELGQPRFDRGRYLEQLHHELSKTDRAQPDYFNPETMGGNIANQVSHRRTLYFKDTSAFDYDMKYGSGNTSGLIVEQIIKRAELNTLMDHFGADYKSTWNGVMGSLGRAGQWRFSKLGRIDMTFQHLTGDLNHPLDATLAAKGQAVRQAMNSVSLWMSGISSITDYGNVTSSLRWMGMEPKEMNQHLLNSMREHMSKDTKGREFLIAQGAGLQAILTGFTQQQLMRGPAYRLAQKASDITFKYCGLETSSRIFQSAFHDLTTQHLGEMAGKKMTPELANWLDHYGITQEEWGAMSKHSTEIDGLQGKRLAPDLVKEPLLADKLRTAIHDTVHQAVLEPSVSDKAYLTFGTKAGTRLGEAVRCINQYKGYPLAMIRREGRRFANGYGNEGLYAFGSKVNRGQMDWVVWAGTMLSLAGTVLAIKDILRGREPMNPFDPDQWTVSNAARLVSQAGVGPLAVAEQFLSPQQLLGPAPGSAYGLAKNAVTGNGYGVTNSVMGLLPGSSLAPVREASKAMLGAIFTDTYGVHYQNFLKQLQQEKHQTSIFLDNNATQPQ